MEWNEEKMSGRLRKSIEKWNDRNKVSIKLKWCIRLDNNNPYRCMVSRNIANAGVTHHSVLMNDVNH